MKLTLKTMSFNNCTVGKLYVGGVHLCNTIEKPYNDNKPSVSCIPAGIYQLNQTVPPKFGKTFCLENPDLDVSLSGDTKRTHILIHKANFESELLGRIAPVSSFGVIPSNNEWAGLSSGKAYSDLMALLSGSNHTIEIKRE